jgi:cobalt-precorrin 5A hydrolase
VVVVDVAGRWAISLLSGHEGGANRLADRAAALLGAEPVVTTTTEAARRLVAGIGFRKGTSAEDLAGAVLAALSEAGRGFSELRVLASAERKASDPALLGASVLLGCSLRIVPDIEIRSCRRRFERRRIPSKRVGLPAVAEPCALVAGRRTVPCLKRTVRKEFPGIVVSIAEEASSWWESDPEPRATAR